MLYQFSQDVATYVQSLQLSIKIESQLYLVAILIIFVWCGRIVTCGISQNIGSQFRHPSQLQ